MKNWKLIAGLVLCSHAAFAAENVTIYAASSMTNAVDDMITAFEEQSDVKVTTVYGSSSSLARQIEHGAPADVFLSANEKWVTYLIDQQAVDSEKVILLAGNELALIKPSESNLEAFDLSDAEQWKSLLTGSRMAVGNTDAVPVGIYAKQALQNLNVWQSVNRHLAQSSNVRAALALVERGETPLGVVYKTDAQLTDKVTTVALFDSSLYGQIHYPLAQLSTSESSNLLIEFMQSEQAREILTGYGFRTDMGNEKFAD